MQYAVVYSTTYVRKYVRLHGEPHKMKKLPRSYHQGFSTALCPPSENDEKSLVSAEHCRPQFSHDHQDRIVMGHMIALPKLTACSFMNKLVAIDLILVRLVGLLSA